MRSHTATALLALAVAAWAAPRAAAAQLSQPGDPPSGRPALEAGPTVFVTEGWTLVPSDQEKGRKPAKPAADQGGTKQGEGKKGEKKKDEGVTFTFEEMPSIGYRGLFRLDVRLLVQWDARWPGQGDPGTSGDTFSLVRRRLGIQGALFGIVEYEVERELKSGGPWRDVFVNVRARPYVEVRAGKFKLPFGREELDSPRDRNFVFRSLVTSEVAPQRAVGGMLHGRLLGRRIRYEAAVVDGDGDNSPPIEDPPFQLTEDDTLDTGRSVAGRVVVAPFGGLPARSPLRSLEFGAAMMSSTLAPGMNHFRGTTAFGTRFFPRSLYVNGTRSRLGAEFHWAPGPCSFQAEYVRAEEERLGMGVGSEAALDNDLPPLVTEGWYAAGTWLLTGERKAGRVRPRRPLLKGGFGAVELAARYDLLRIGAGDTAAAATTSPRAADVASASDRVATVGLNWYVNDWVKIQLNAIRENVQGSRRAESTRPTFWGSVLRIQFSM